MIGMPARTSRRRWPGRLTPSSWSKLSTVSNAMLSAPTAFTFSSASHRDPAAYSFAHGGKDGHPYSVNRALYDANLERLRETIGRAKIGETDKVASLKALMRFTSGLR